MYFEQAIGLMSVVVSLLAGLGTIYIALQLSWMRRIYTREAHASRMLRTLEAIRFAPHVSQTIGFVLYSRAEGKALDLQDLKLREDIFATLSTLEILANGVLADVYDESIVYSSLGYSLTEFFEIVQPLIYESRSRRTSADLFIQIEHLARRWKMRGSYSNSRTGEA